MRKKKGGKDGWDEKDGRKVGRTEEKRGGRIGRN